MENNNRLGILIRALLISGFYLTILVLGVVKKTEEKLPADIYGPIATKDYVLGLYQPSKHPDFVELSTLGILTGSPNQYLRKEAAQSLRTMLNAFHADHPQAEVWVESATRSYQYQKSIWSSKWRGDRLVAGNNLSVTTSDFKQRALAILKHSAMPGTSRHHWGTEIDFNRLQNDYYDAGDGRILYNWLQQNALRYRFCQPYTAGRSKGHLEERWHWSYRPLSRQYLSQWNKLFWKSRTQQSTALNFEGAKEALAMANTYANQINRQCK